MIKAVFFDLDGTLVDTHKANFEAYKQALAYEGISIEYKDFKKTIGMQAKDFLPLLGPGLSEKAIERISQNKAREYSKLGHKTVLNLELKGFLEQMRNSPIKTVLVTTAKKANASVILSHHCLDNMFDFCIFAEDVKNSKPHPEAYMLALKKCGLTPSEAIAFEDSESGIRAAQSAGIAVIIIKEFQV